MTRSRKAGIGAVLALVLAFGVWWFGFRSDQGAVFESAIPAVKTAPLRPPQYAAEISAPGPSSPGLVVRSGHETRRVLGPNRGVWLNDGRLLVKQAGGVAVLDPRTGRLDEVEALAGHNGTSFPGEALHRLTLAARAQVFLSVTADLKDRKVLRPPEYDGKRNPIHMIRSTDNRIFSIGDWDYVRFSDTDGEDFTEQYGYLRHNVRTDTWDKALLGKRMVALWVSSDGRALLGLQQTRGRPCGGCGRSQQIVEIDPNKGEIAATYGVPETYDRSWRVADIDKTDARVLVRYVHRNNVPENLGVWQYDGSWRLVPGTEGAFTWWQGPDDRIEARPPKVIENPEGFYYSLYWVHGSTSTRLPGRILKDDVETFSGVPGSLVPLHRQ